MIGGCAGRRERRETARQATAVVALAVMIEIIIGPKIIRFTRNVMARARRIVG
jgi:hypothetical protein